MKINRQVMLIITLLFGLLSTVAFADAFTQTEIFSFKAKNGTPIFTDKKPKNNDYKTKVIQAAKATQNGQYQAQQREFLVEYKHQNVEYQPTSKKKSRSRSKKVKSKVNETSIKTCKKYKRRLEKVSEKMRVGYTAKQYRGLEAKRVKYRDLLFYNCNSHELL